MPDLRENLQSALPPTKKRTVVAKATPTDLARLITEVVKLTLPKDANIHAKEYQLYLPSKELLRQKLLEWARAAESGT